MTLAAVEKPLTKPVGSTDQTAGMAAAARLIDGVETPPEETFKQETTVRLTPRQLEAISLIIEGLSNLEAAEIMFISKRTVDFHLADVYEILQVSNRVQAFRRLVGLGIKLLTIEEVKARQ